MAEQLFAGIGHAHSDESLHAARVSPATLAGTLTDQQIDRLYHATRATLNGWIARLSQQFGSRFPGPGEITAFRDGFAAHGRFGKPCPDCRSTIQRIRYAKSETNYCPKCQTGGRILADRSLSRLLKNDWPRSASDSSNGAGSPG
ncbi:MAG: hypothetical protein IID37_14595 [Planctomycetes bacterium]|nr:hypothetical protein [Planctomycetota bacterium]